MRATVLFSPPPVASAADELWSALSAELAHAGYDEVRRFDVAALSLAFCQGELDCWVKTPGTCRAHDAEEEIVRAVHGSDALVMVEPVTFGGHCHSLKRAVDRLICLVSPFFVRRASLTHHEPRYERLPSHFGVGWFPASSQEEARTYADLIDAAALNLFAPHHGVAIVNEPERAAWPGAIRAMLASKVEPGSTITGRPELRRALLDAARPDAAQMLAAPIRRAALLVGSAKPKGTSASEAIGGAFLSRLEQLGVATEIHRATSFVRDAEAPNEQPRRIAFARDGDTAREHARRIAACDLFVLATPLYVDSLPSLVTHALSLVARAREDRHDPARFVVILNCGFPEAEHNRTALRITRHFAKAAGYLFAGGLPLGGGGVVKPERPLDQPHGPTAHITRALDLAAPEIAAGRALPLEAILAMAEPSMPEVVYRLAGDLGWRWQAHKNGLTQRALGAEPLDRPEP